MQTYLPIDELFFEKNPHLILLLKNHFENQTKFPELNLSICKSLRFKVLKMTGVITIEVDESLLLFLQRQVLVNGFLEKWYLMSIHFTVSYIIHR